METIIGIVRVQRDFVDSKSEGLYAHIIQDSGEDYILYRPHVLAMDDVYFHEFDGKQVKIIGEIEQRLGYLCVEEIVTI
ncbi:MAG: hypothetical protein J6S09_08220 [Paludibacteraceae bacterium]|jgi:hypothetical protein|nr:hypothetical protein [Paludibacteraceae bacterium]